MRQRILVLGAAGFIGRRIVERLSGDPRVLTVAAVRTARPYSFPAGVEVLTLDATHADALAQAVKVSQGVVNCVAGSEGAIRAGAQALASALNQCIKPPRLVHLSSLAVYGSATGTVSELSPLKGDLDGYAAAKVAAEHALGASPSVVVLRPGIVYGPGSPLWSTYIGRLLVAGRLGSLGADGNGICNLVYIDDLVAVICVCLDLPGITGKHFNISGSAPTWNEYFSLYAAALKAPAPRPMSKLRLATEVRIVSPLLKIAELFAGSRANGLPPPLRPWLLNICRHQIRMDTTLAENELGMRPISTANGLETTAKWFRDSVRA